MTIRYGLSLKLDMENSAFCPRATEAARILRSLADKLENMHSGLDNNNHCDGLLFDANGNRCGAWEAKPRRIRD